MPRRFEKFSQALRQSIFFSLIDDQFKEGRLCAASEKSIRKHLSLNTGTTWQNLAGNAHISPNLY